MPKQHTIRAFFRSDFARHGSLVFISTSIVNFASYALNLAISRWVGVAGYGVVASLTSTLVILSIPSAVFATIIVKQGAELNAVGDTRRLAAFSKRTLQISASATLFTIAATVLAHDALARYLHLADPRLTLVAGAILALATLTITMRALLQARHDFHRFAYSTLLEGGLRAVLGIALVSINHEPLNAMLGWLAAEAIAATYTIVASRSPAATNDDGAVAVYLDWRRIAQASAGVGASAAILTTLGFADMILVKHFFRPREAGLYGALSLGGRVLTFGLGFIPTIVLPKATAKAMRGESALPILRAAAIVCATVASLVLLVVGLEPTVFLRALVGTAYADAAPYLLPYCVAATLLTFAGLAATYKTALHRFQYVGPTAIVALGEITAITLFHATIGDIVRTLVIGAALVLCTTSWGLWSKPAVSPDTRSGDAVKRTELSRQT